MEEIEEEEGPQREEIVPGVARALSPLVRRITATNPGPRTGIGTNTYLVGIDEIVVIDPGPLDDMHISTIAGCGGDRIVWIITTSEDPAHAESVAKLQEMTGAEVLEPKDGSEIVGTEFRLKVHHLPGTHPDHRGLFLAEERLLLSGDLIVEGSTVAIEPDNGGDMSVYMESLAKVRKLRLKRIAPGHGHLLEDANDVIDELIAHREQREESVLAAVKGGTDAPADIVAALYEGLDSELVELAQAQVQAHIIKLQADGKL